jgi:hypothetical protein
MLFDQKSHDMHVFCISKNYFKGEITKSKSIKNPCFFAKNGKKYMFFAEAKIVSKM